LIDRWLATEQDAFLEISFLEISFLEISFNVVGGAPRAARVDQRRSGRVAPVFFNRPRNDASPALRDLIAPRSLIWKTASDHFLSCSSGRTSSRRGARANKRVRRSARRDQQMRCGGRSSRTRSTAAGSPQHIPHAPAFDRGGTATHRWRRAPSGAVLQASHRARARRIWPR
jgi:hypothetical protein